MALVLSRIVVLMITDSSKCKLKIIKTEKRRQEKEKLGISISNCETGFLKFP